MSATTSRQDTPADLNFSNTELRSQCLRCRAEVSAPKVHDAEDITAVRDPNASERIRELLTDFMTSFESAGWEVVPVIE